MDILLLVNTVIAWIIAGVWWRLALTLPPATIQPRMDLPARGEWGYLRGRLQDMFRTAVNNDQPAWERCCQDVAKSARRFAAAGIALRVERPDLED